MAEPVNMMKEIETMAAFPTRGPTKPGERQAAEYLAGRLDDLGLDAAIEGYKVSPHYYWVYFTHTTLAILAGVATIWTRPAWIPWLMAGILAFITVSFWGDLTTKFHLIRNIIPRYPSQNVVASIPKEGARKRIIVSAHIDAAKVGELVFNPKIDEAVAKFYKEKFDSTPNVMMPILACMVGMLAVAVVRGIFASGAAMWIVTWIIQGICTLGLLVATVSFFDIGVGIYVPGACDNLSGIAACMSICEKVLAEPLENSELVFAAFGCEEAIMMGAVQYMKKHGRELDRDNTYFINLESIGYGTVRYGTSEGFVRVRPYSEELVSIARGLKESGEFSEIGTYDVRLGTDAMVPLVRGFKAISILGFNENNFVPNYHTPQDTPENMDIRVTERARDLALRMIRELDA
jgi:hypothetical protein